jgi:type IV pili sensor histidine kinase/response regulator
MLRGFSLVHLFCRYLVITVLAAILLFSQLAQAESTSQMGRYLTVSHQALPQQVDLLSQTFQVRFPRCVCCVGDAIRYLLSCSGYRLVEPSMLSKSVQALLCQPLSQAHRKLGPMSLQDGLFTLTGQPFDLVVDPVHRLVGFQLNPGYQTLYREE